MNKNCLVCGKPFSVDNYKKDTAKYCSRVCQHQAMFRREKRECPSCHKLFEVRASSKAKFCSKVCFGLSEVGGNNHAWEGGPLTKTCPICQKKFVVPKKSYDKTYCSHPCRCKGYAQHRARIETRICVHCQKEFLIRPSGRSKFCSLTCYHADYREHPERYNVNLQKSPPVHLNCKTCGKPFVVNKARAEKEKPLYCSYRCMGLDPNRSQGANNPNFRDATITGLCQQCGKKFVTTKWHQQRKLGRYCSVACKSLWQSQSGVISGPNSGTWLGGKSFEPYGYEFNTALKRTIKNRDQHTCRICGKTGVKLAVHHSDYDKRNNSPDNLFTLCFPCHSMTNTNRKKWKAFFQRLVSGGKR